MIIINLEEEQLNLDHINKKIIIIIKIIMIKKDNY